MDSRFAGVDAARGRFGDAVVDRVVGLARAADPPADALAAALGGRAGSAVDLALAGGPCPPEVRAVVAAALDPPAWVDLDLVDAGAVATWRTGGALGTLTLTCGSLAYGYRSASLSRPLAATGRLTQMAPRRLAETARWYVEATRPGALRPGGAGLRATVRLRVVHALVRAHLRGSWDVGAWGEPLSRADTLATGLGGFFLVPRRALADLGVRHRPAEVEALFALWRWICCLMGVPEEDLPGSVAEAEAWLDCALALDSGPHEASPELMRALLRHGYAMERFLPGPAAAVSRTVAEQVLGAFTRRWMGDAMADRLGVPDTPLKHAAPLLRPAALAREAVLAVVGDDARVAALELAVVEQVMGLLRAAPEAITPERVADRPVLRAA
jgi:hypothetical protein